MNLLRHIQSSAFSQSELARNGHSETDMKWTKLRIPPQKRCARSYRCNRFGTPSYAFFGGDEYVTSAFCSSKWPALIRFLFLRRALVSLLGELCRSDDA